MDAMSTAGENENLFLDALTTIHHAQLAIADTVPRLKGEREREWQTHSFKPIIVSLCFVENNCLVA